MSAELKTRNAVNKLDERKGLTAELSIDATADQIFTAMKGEDITRENADLLAALRLSFTVSSDKELKDLKATDKKTAVGVTFSTDSGKSNAVEIRSVNEMLYLRADLKGLADLGGAKGEDRATIDSLLASAGSLPSSLAAVKAALQGKWIGLDLKAFGEFGKTLGEKSGAPIPPLPVPTTNPLDAATQKLITDAVGNAVKDHAKFADAGSKDGEDHITVTVEAGKSVRELAAALKPLEKKIPGLPLSDLNTAPDKNVTLDLAIKDGALSGLTVDLAQFNETPGKGVPLHIGLSGQDTPLKAPAGAKTLNPQDLLGAAMELMPALGGPGAKA